MAIPRARNAHCLRFRRGGFYCPRPWTLCTGLLSTPLRKTLYGDHAAPLPFSIQEPLPPPETPFNGPVSDAATRSARLPSAV